MSQGSGSTTNTPGINGSGNLSQPAPNYSYYGMPTADTAAITNTVWLPQNADQMAGFNPQLPAQWGADVVQNSATLGNNLAGVTQNAGLPGYASMALQTGFDPQNALYNRTLQQTMDASNVANAANGVAGTPYGAGLADQNLQNFNIDWQNQALQRQQTGASTANALLGQYGQGINTASNIYDTGLNTGANMGLSGAQLATNQYGTQISDLLAYLQGGESAQSATAQSQLGYDNALTSLFGAGANAQANVNSSSAGLGSGIGDLLGLGLGFGLL